MTGEPSGRYRDYRAPQFRQPEYGWVCVAEMAMPGMASERQSKAKLGYTVDRAKRFDRVRPLD